MFEVSQLIIQLVEGKERKQLVRKLNEFRMENKVNHHATLRISGEIENEITIAADSMIEVKQGETLIFTGAVVDYQITAQTLHYTVELKAISQTGELDLEPKRRSFQDEQMLYSDLVKTILAEYPKATYGIDSQLSQKVLGGFYLQFDETDWEFLVRMASCLNTVVIADPVAEKPKLHLGLPKPSANAQLQPKTEYRWVKKAQDYQLHLVNQLVDKPLEADYDFYEAEATGDLACLGDPVKYQGRDLLVYQTTLIQSRGQLIQQCILAPVGGFRPPRQYNERLAGLTVKGVVKDRRAQSHSEAKPVAVKVSLNVDRKYHQKHNTKESGSYCWFPYASFFAAEGHTGLFALPETGDQVALYFPGKREAEAFVTNAVRSKRVKIDNPNIKCLETGFGKKILFDEHGIKIVARENSVYIAIEDNGAVTVHSGSQLTLRAKESLTVEAGGTIAMEAGSQLNINGNGCRIMMNGQTVFTGTQVPKNINYVGGAPSTGGNNGTPYVPGNGKQLVTYEQLRQLRWNNLTNKVVDDLNKVLCKYNITSTMLIRHFLSQVMHESGRGKWVLELGGRSYFDKYEPGTSIGNGLGNRYPGDGWKYRGAGYIQLTGRSNYQNFANGVGDPSIMNGADYVAQNYAWEAAGFWWNRNRMNALVNGGATVEQVTRRVNGGTNGLADRKQCYNECTQVIR